MLYNLLRNPAILAPFLFVFMEEMGHLLEVYVRLDMQRDKAEMLRNLREEKMDFDFIIVGCGSAGSALALKLSSKYEVLVLDVGGAPDPLLEIPAYAFLLNSLQPVDFAHRTVPQKHAAFGLIDNVSHWPAGKQLGGTSTVHTLTYSRGNVQGFEAMAEELGDGKWRTDHILQYYNKIENYHGWYDNPGNHGKEGDMYIERSYASKFIHHLLDGGIELGYPVRDPNHGFKNTEGFAYADNHMKFGRRHDAFTGYLKNSSRTKPVIRKFSYVKKINFDDSLTATGVTYDRHRRTFTVRARKEVILSAGALGTAKLLMLSGIGPKEDLERIGIKCIADLPVGQSLQDMYGVIMGPFTVRKGYSFIRDRDVTIPSMHAWMSQGTGPVASSKIEASYDIQSNFSKSQNNSNAPDLHTIVIAASADTMGGNDFERAFNFNHRSMSHFARTIGEDSFYQTVSLYSPKQSGEVKLRDSNPWTSLQINPRYLEHPDDMKVLLEGMRFAIKLAEETKAMRNIQSKLLRIPFPGCEEHEFTHDRISDEYLECLARHATMTTYRYCGTAPIGFKGNPNRVVDRDFRVVDVQRLRVVDASVLQLKYATVSDSTVRMLGEFASDVINNCWNNQTVCETFRNNAENDSYD